MSKKNSSASLKNNFKIIKGFSKKVVDGIKKGAKAIESICEAWQKGVVNANAK